MTWFWDVYFEITFIVGNVVFIMYWLMYVIDSENVVRRGNARNFYQDKWLHGGTTFMYWIDLLLITKHTVRLSLRKVSITCLVACALYYLWL